MDNFNYLPNEIVEIIISFASDKEKRLFRSTNKKWRERLENNNFTFYFTRATTVPLIVDHLLRYYGDKPLRIKFSKRIELEMQYFMPYLAQLTNLRAIHFENIYGYTDKKRASRYATSLTNLEEISPQPTYPFTKEPFFISLTKLKQLEFYYQEGYGINIKELKLFTDLETLSITTTLYDPFVLVANPSRLTKLTINCTAIPVTDETLKKMQQFNNLKYLHYSEGDSRTANLTFTSLTSLETLHAYSIESYGVEKLTRLTQLIVLRAWPNEQLLSISKLVNLRSLSLTTTMIDESILEAILRPLTALEYLFVGRNLAHLDASSPLKAINSKNFTHLKIDCINKHFTTKDNFAALTNLRVLDLQRDYMNSDPVDYSGLSYLSLLTELKLLTNEFNDSLVSINSLTNLKILRLSPYTQRPAMVPAMTISNLINLEHLDMEIMTPEIFNEIKMLSNLTSLSVALEPQLFENNNNDNIFSSLPKLKRLNCSNKTHSEIFWTQLPQLTALEYLSLWKVDREDRLLLLTGLTNLTQLALNRSHAINGVYLTLLTNIQDLYFISKRARKLYEQDLTLNQKMPYLWKKNFRT